MLQRVLKSIWFISLVAVTAALIHPSLPLAWAQTIDFRTSEEIKTLNLEISKKSDLIEELGERAQELAKLIAENQEQATTLEHELALINNRIAKLELDIERRREEVSATELEIKETNLQLEEKERSIDFQKVQLSSLIRELHRQDKRGNLEILFVHDSLSSFFSYVRHLEDVQANVQVSLAGLKDGKRHLEVFERELELEKANLQQLLLELQVEQEKLEQEKAGQEALIEETELSEAEFQKRLGEIRFQQRVADEEIRNLEVEIKEKLRQAQLKNPNLVLNPGQLLWPIPNQGITTYFHDPGYPFRHIVGEHSGLDLRTLINGTPRMGMPLRAPASGIVVKTIANGKFTGNAIFLSHGDLMTVFYHLSEIYVQPDQFVNIGDTIGATGGAPGHPGAGLSSGPHLHFEVRQNGIPVDPCAYLSPSC